MPNVIRIRMFDRNKIKTKSLNKRIKQKPES